MSRPVAGCVLCCDLDGVVWRGDEAIPGGDSAYAALTAAGVRVVFVTNNSAARRSDYVAKLARCGIGTNEDALLTSAAAASRWLESGARLAPGARVFACAGAGVVDAIAGAGFVPVTVDDPAPREAEAIVIGWHASFDFAELTVAADIARSGVPFVATNDDPTYPGAAGRVLPGNGSIVAAVATAAGRAPVVVGKPHAVMAQLVLEQVGTVRRAAMVGDRLSTDGAFAATLGWPFALVLSGIAGSAGGEALPDPPPAFLGPDLAAVTPDLIGWFTS